MKLIHSSTLAFGLTALIFAACSDGESGERTGSAGGSTGNTGGTASGGTSSSSGGTVIVGNGGDGATGGCDPYTGQGCGAGGESSYVAACSNGIIDVASGEVCDDGNADSGDGCTANCDQVEENFVCPTPGEPCVSTVDCGDGKISGDETCDDANENPSDGCDAACQLESGWACPIPGIRCQAAECGDGIIAGKEQCDFVSPEAGCDSTTCQIDPVYACDDSGCHVTTCGDGVTEGSEACDQVDAISLDKDNNWGDGCTPNCQKEPDCSAGACTSTCGDGIKLPGDANEECDDGNVTDGDGCSHDCLEEEGYACAPAEPDMKLPMVLRDFIGWCPSSYNVSDDNSACDKKTSDSLIGHFDFEIQPNENPGRQIDGTVQASLDLAGKPVNSYGNGPLTPSISNGYTTGQTNFQWWYRDSATYNETLVTSIQLIETTPGTWQYTRNPFWPLDIDPPGADPALQSLVATNLEKAQDSGHDFYFTSETRYWFQFSPDADTGNDPELTFYGDDDVWVFIKGMLTVDIGGIHGQDAESVSINDDGDATVHPFDDPNIGGTPSDFTVNLNLEASKVYEIVVFQAERHVTGSNYQLTLQGFAGGKSKCESVCGDGIVTPDEVCDDGVNAGGYNGCMPGCQARGPYCGDSEIQADDGETCDDGVNLSQYGGCAPGCVAGPYCGDGKVQSKFEACDDAENNGGYNECGENCQLGARCGDGAVQDGEECDDGNRMGGDGCDGLCQYEIVK